MEKEKGMRYYRLRLGFWLVGMKEYEETTNMWVDGKRMALVEQMTNYLENKHNASI